MELDNPETELFILKSLCWIKHPLLLEECKAALYAKCLLKGNKKKPTWSSMAGNEMTVCVK